MKRCTVGMKRCRIGLKRCLDRNRDYSPRFVSLYAVARMKRCAVGMKRCRVGIYETMHRWKSRLQFPFRSFAQDFIKFVAPVPILITVRFRHLQKACACLTGLAKGPIAITVPVLACAGTGRKGGQEMRPETKATGRTRKMCNLHMA